MEVFEKYDFLKRISNELRLDFETQDWGIINSCPDRLEEFIQYFKSNSHYPDIIKYDLFELIIASYNDFLLEENYAVNKSIVNEFIKENSNLDNLKPIIEYWAQLDENEYPISQLLKVM